MNRSTFISLLALAPWLAAQSPDKKLRVLLMTGGHAFERLPFLALFLANPAIELTEAAHEGKSATAWEREDLLTYDVIVLYDMMQSISEAGQKQFAAARAKGIGMVVLHHALVAYQKWPEYESIIGGCYPEADGQAGKVTEAVGYQHNVEIPVTVLNKTHPATAGLDNFTLTDEIYWGFRVGNDVTPLLGTTQEKSGKVLAWAKTAEKSRLVYLQLGHGPSAWSNENYRKFLAQAIHWVAGKDL